MHGRLTFLLLLLGLCAPALHDLPLVVALSEEAAPGTRVAEVTVSCSNASGSPNVTLHGVEPGHPFNPIAISVRLGGRGVTLRAGAELDAQRVNQYTLTLRAACPGEEEVEERLFVRVTAGQVLRCDAPFASTGRRWGAGGAGSQVPETVSPGETLVTLKCTHPTGTEDCLRYALEGPPASLSRFHMEGSRLQVRGPWAVSRTCRSVGTL
uniref:Uncharacterized protein n=1 Tax=Calidris pygmaea TaxID=425635 RepID=A0A8C3JA59_9CHAR